MAIAARLARRLLAVMALFVASSSIAGAYTLEFMDKWGNSFFQTFGPVSSTPGGLMLGSIRTAVDAQYGAGAFEAAVNNAFAAWASVAFSLGNNFQIASGNDGAPADFMQQQTLDVVVILTHPTTLLCRCGHTARWARRCCSW